MLKQFRDSALSRRLGGIKLSVDNCLQALLLRAKNGSFAIARFLEDKLVVRFETSRGVVVRGYGKSLAEALRYALFQVVCAGGDCI